MNKVFLIGNLTRDPELTYTPTNTAVCKVGLAHNRRWRDKDGNNKEDVCFVECVAYGKQAETINQYFQKGRRILLEGRLRFNEWEDKDGRKRSRLDVVLERFEFVGDSGRDAKQGDAEEVF